MNLQPTSKSPRPQDPWYAPVRLLALLGSDAPLNALLERLATHIEACTEDLYCSVLLADPTGRLLRPGAAPSLPAAYVEAIDPVPICVGHGSCGTAAALREIVVVEDVERSELWSAYAPIAIEHGLRACWSVPIVADARGLLGTLALYYRVPRTPTAAEIDLLQVAASLAAVVIQRHRDAARLRDSEERYRTLARLVQGYVFEGQLRPDQNIEFTWADDGFADLFGCERVEVNRRGWRSFVDKRDLAAVEKRLTAIAAGNTSAIELRITGTSGRQRWLRMAAEPFRRNDDEAMFGIIGMAEDVTERKTLTEQMFEAVTREQRRIAHDLHDELGQVLTGASLLLRGYHTAVARGVAVTAQEIERVLELVTGAIDSTRSLAHGLAPGTLDCGGLASALENLARQGRRWFGLEIDIFTNFENLGTLDVATSDHLYRIVQEAITNVARHAHARCVGIHTGTTPDALVIDVIDDGVGIADGAGQGFGLRTMLYRADTIGAELAIEQIHPHGTRVSVRLPLRSAAWS